MQKIDKTDVLKKILSGRRFTVDYFQREYRWGRKQIEQMISDFQGTFEDLLLIYLNNLQKAQETSQDEIIKLDDMIFDTHFGKKTFNIDVPEREKCMYALFNGDSSYVADNESAQNMLDRYADIEDKK